MLTENLLSSELQIERLKRKVKVLEGQLEEARKEGVPVESLVKTQAMANSSGEGLRAEEWKIRKVVRGLVPDVKRHEFVVAAQARMLMKLYEHREFGIEPTLLFGYAGVKRQTGYRYISLLKDKKYVGFIGARQQGKYMMTSLGRRVMEGVGMGDGR